MTRGQSPLWPVRLAGSSKRANSRGHGVHPVLVVKKAYPIQARQRSGTRSHLPTDYRPPLTLDAETRPVLEPDAEVQRGGLRGRFQFVDLGLAVALGVVPAPVWCGPVHAGLGSRPGGGGLSDQRVPGSDAAAVAQSGGLPALREEERLFHPPGGTGARGPRRRPTSKPSGRHGGPCCW